MNNLRKMIAYSVLLGLTDILSRGKVRGLTSLPGFGTETEQQPLSEKKLVKHVTQRLRLISWGKSLRHMKSCDCRVARLWQVRQGAKLIYGTCSEMCWSHP